MILKVMLLVLIIGVNSHLFVDSTGEQTLEPIFGRAVRLPNTTEITDTTGTLNLISEMRLLRSELENLWQFTESLNATVTTLQAEAQNSTATAGCSWEGVYCDCFLEDTQDHAVVLVGSLCSDSILQWVKVLDMHIATLILDCIGVVNSTQCDGFF